MTEAEATILTLLLPPRDAGAAFHPPREFGAERGSHHAVTASRMVAKGWVVRQRCGGGEARPAWAYKVTPGGQQALYNHYLPKIEARRQRIAAGGSR
jgi:hypothetical protein